MWLKDNVGGFGGDGGRLTLVGHGTGASIVNLLMISPLASGKMTTNNVLKTKGSPVVPIAIRYRTVGVFKRLN